MLVAMWKTSIFSDLSAPTENKRSNSYTRPNQCSLGSNQEGFEESNPQGWQAPTCRQNVEQELSPDHQRSKASINQGTKSSSKQPNHHQSQTSIIKVSMTSSSKSGIPQSRILQVQQSKLGHHNMPPKNLQPTQSSNILQVDSKNSKQIAKLLSREQNLQVDSKTSKVDSKNQASTQRTLFFMLPNPSALVPK